MEYFNLFCYCITYSNIGLYHKISLFFDLLTTWILGDFHSDLLRFTPQHSVVSAMTILMMLHLLSYQQSPLQLLAVYILQFTPFSYCLPNHTGLYTWYKFLIHACFQISFYFSLVYMHPQYMILDLNLMSPSQSKHSFLIWNANTFQFFIVHEVKGLGPFSILVQVKLGHFNFTKWICQEYSKFQLWW